MDSSSYLQYSCSIERILPYMRSVYLAFLLRLLGNKIKAESVDCLLAIYWVRILSSASWLNVRRFEFGLLSQNPDLYQGFI